MLMHSQISLFFMVNLNDTYPKIEEHQPVNGLTVPSHRQLVLASKVDISLWIPCGAWLGVVLQPLAGSPWGSCESSLSRAAVSSLSQADFSEDDIGTCEDHPQPLM